MAWSYVEANIGSSSRAWVRWRVGDTDQTDQLQSDAEIDASVADYGDKRAAGAATARAIAGKFARRMDSKMGKLDLKASQLYDHFIALGDVIDMEVAVSGAVPWSGAPSNAEKTNQQEDNDRVRPSFARNMFAVERTVHGETSISSSTS